MSSSTSKRFLLKDGPEAIRNEASAGFILDAIQARSKQCQQIGISSFMAPESDTRRSCR